MPFCKNNKNKRYTGKEKNPRGRGYAASSEKDGQIRKGKDGKMYRASGNRWTLVRKKEVKRGILSPMSRKKKKKTVSFEEESEEEEEEDETWKYNSAKEGARLSDFFCKETLYANVALLSWAYFKDWYNRVRYGEDPYQAYENVKLKN